jgi:hypothetical protein
MRFFPGTSTPIILGMVSLLALALFVARIGTNHTHDPFAPHNPAAFTNTSH